MQSWQLSENNADILLYSVHQIENGREQLLVFFCIHKFEFVSSSILEYSTSLPISIGKCLSLKTIPAIDQNSVHQLSLRADITSQVVSIYAHLLSTNNGINQLCNAESVWYDHPDGILSTRESLLFGTEIYGYAGIEANIELIDLMLKSLAIVNINFPTLSLCNNVIFNAVDRSAELNSQRTTTLLQFTQNKVPKTVEGCIKHWLLKTEWIKALPTLSGTREVIQIAYNKLSNLFSIQIALQQLQQICTAFLQHDIFIYLSKLSVDSGFCFDLHNLVKHLFLVEQLQNNRAGIKDADTAESEIENIAYPTSGSLLIIIRKINISRDGTPICLANQQWQIIHLSQ